MGRDHSIRAPPPPPPAPRQPIPGKNDPVAKEAHRKTLRSLFLFDVERHSVVTWDRLQKALTNGLGFAIDGTLDGSRVKITAPERFGGRSWVTHKVAQLCDERQKQTADDMKQMCGFNERKLRKLLRGPVVPT